MFEERTMSGMKYGPKIYPFLQYLNRKYENRVLNIAPTREGHEKEWDFQIR